MIYRSTFNYEKSRIHAAAIYCSDGRVGEHFDEFLHVGLKLPRYDRVALPGGPASLAGHTEAHVEEEGVVDELRFLVEVHGLSRVVLIQHTGCAFYHARLHLPPSLIDAQQKIDLVKSANFIRRLTSIQAVEAYFAHIRDDKVDFEPVDIGS